jgi:hypothetical protein
MSKDNFVDVPIADDPDRSHELLAIRVNERGYRLSAIRLNFHENLLEFVQVDFPDGTSAYFIYDTEVEEGFRAGPFGGGYSWAVPKYVVKAAGELILETFQQTQEEVPA